MLNCIRGRYDSNLQTLQKSYGSRGGLVPSIHVVHNANDKRLPFIPYKEVVMSKYHYEPNCLASAVILSLIMLVIYGIIGYLLFKPNPVKCIQTNKGKTAICGKTIYEVQK